MFILFALFPATVHAQATPVWTEGFEGIEFWDEWHVEGGTWGVGKPTGVGPSGAFSGLSCAGTVLNGNYAASTDGRLVRDNSFTVPPASENPVLRFWHWFDVRPGDTATVEIRPAGESWQTISPVYTYTSSAWTRTALDLRAYGGKSVQIAFHLKSNTDASVGAGWYIDEVELVSGAVPYSLSQPEGFEAGLGDWNVDKGDWQVGRPVGGPGSAFRGVNCAGTVLSGNYDAGIDSRLISPEFVVPSALEQPRLRFWHWHAVSSGDSAVVEVRPVGGTWQPISVVYTNTSSVWTRTSLDLASYAGQTVQIGFRLKANTDAGVATGWYVDEVEVATGALFFHILNSPDGFEAGMGDWSSEKGDWQVGVPAAGPTKAFRGTYCAGTVLTGNYDAGIDSRLISPEFVVPSALEQPRLRFWHWHAVSSGDSAVVEVRPVGGTWQPISVVYTNTSSVWTRASLDLASYAGQTVQIGFRLKANTDAGVATGWYVDEVEVASGPVLFTMTNRPEGFELGLGDWNVERGSWQVGAPSTPGPSSACLGSYCAGTVLAGNYNAGADSRLISPEFTIPAATEQPRLRFWHWFSLGSGDQAVVEIRVAGGAWQILSSVYTNTGGVWTRPVIDLGPFAGQSAQLAFRLKANTDASVAAGWYIDDVEVASGPIMFSIVNQPEGFEQGPGEWSAERGDWQVGIPTGGPGKAFRGTNCAGTILAGNYDTSLNSRLVSPEFVLPCAESSPRLRFAHWFKIASPDQGFVEIWTEEAGWRSLGASISGTSSEWVTAFYDLTALAGLKVRLGFRLSSNTDASVDAGWYLDEIRIQADVLLPIQDFTVVEESLVAFPVVAVCPDVEYSLAPGAPDGAALDPALGFFTWVPSECQGPGSYPISVQVAPRGSPHAVAGLVTFLVSVLETNAAPVIDAIEPKTVSAGTPVAFRVTAFDPDCPQTQMLAFSLEQGAPEGATIDSETGEFNWVPTAEQSLVTSMITVRVGDNGAPPLSSTRTFVASPTQGNPRLAIKGLPDGRLELYCEAASAGLLYTIEASSDLSIWKDLRTLSSTDFPVVLPDEATKAAARFYRILIQP